MADFATVITHITNIINLPFDDQEKADMIFRVATKHDPCEPSPGKFLPRDHPLWAGFSASMLGLGGATSFEQVHDVVYEWRERFYVGDEFLHQRSNKRQRSSPEASHASNKFPKLGDHPVQDVPPLPPHSYEGYQSVVESVDEMLAAFETHLTSPGGLLHPATERLFPETEFWKAPSEWTPTSPLASDVAVHVSGLRIPRVPCSSPPQPDMLLYAFGSFGSVDPDFAKRLQGSTLQSSRVMINNASGSGKTKLLHDYLCTCWAILLTCFYDKVTNPYGSEDVYYAFRLLEDQKRHGESGSAFVSKVTSSTGTRNEQEQVHAWQRIWSSNADIAEHVFSLLLLARLLIYQRFRSLSEKLGIESNRAQRSWALLQVCPHLSGRDDIFKALLERLSLVSKADALHQVSTIVSLLNGLDQLPQLLAFDEAQAATTSFTTCFSCDFAAADSPDRSNEDFFRRSIRPVLKPLVRTMHLAIPKARICVSGTKMSADAINEALMSSIAKESAIRQMHELGGHNTPDSISSTFTRFFGAQFSRAIRSMGVWNGIVRWLQGRHRFLAVYVQAILTVGSVDETVLGDLLNAIVSALTGYDVTLDGARDFEFLSYSSMLPSALQRSIMPRILSEPQEYRSDVVRTVTDCIVRFLLTAEYPDYPPEDLTLVELGIGRFDKPPAGKEKRSLRLMVNENLVLLMLFRWFDRAGPDGVSPLRLHLQSTLSNPAGSPKGLVFEDTIIYLLWDWFSGEGAPLSQYFTFRSTKPSWADERARLIFLSDSSGEPPIVQKDTTTGLSVQTGDFVSTIRALARHNGSSALADHIRRPFLKPDAFGGPDVWFALLLACGIQILVSVQFKCWAQGDKVHKDEEIEKLLWKLAPEGWYDGVTNPDLRAALADLEARFPRETLEFPEPSAGTPTLPQANYRDHPVQTAVIRAFVALEGTYELPETMSKQFGCYPIVTLSEHAVKDGCLRFSSFKKIVDVALERQEKRRSKK